MTINFGLAITACGYLCCAIAVHHGDYLLATIGPTLCYLSGYLTKVKTTLTILEPTP